ncbi:TniB family NTP-binding protein [Sphingomonas sp. PR090111-T3T-6A]|uniref:TniB family NTP-binding protein n=1 Tax=Sphingomonas sp. PR090111-T3T-6A TaxID=685778 RepID=UPI000368CC67|nr:TniB family NTP-binding protein [Sphingomonas sp. PR090111-T3T-6A]
MSAAPLPKSPFTDAEFVPVTGHPAPRMTDAVIAEVAAKIEKYDQIHVVTDRHEQAMFTYKRVMAQSAASGRPMLGGRILGPSGSGKTTSARYFRDWVLRQNQHAPDDVPVIIAPLDRACTSRRLFSSILDAIGDDFSEQGTEAILKQRVYRSLRRLNTRLLVIDETQHLRFRSTEANDTTDTLKRMLDDGLCPAIFLGTDEATEFLNQNKQLANRLMPPCDLKPLDRSSPGDRKIFHTYVTELDCELAKAQLTVGKSHLTEKRTLSCLFAISGGVLGRVSNLIRVALDHTLFRGATSIELFDLSHATTSWAVAQDFIGYNPFITGVRGAR